MNASRLLISRALRVRLDMMMAVHRRMACGHLCHTRSRSSRLTMLSRRQHMTSSARLLFLATYSAASISHKCLTAPSCSRGTVGCQRFEKADAAPRRRLFLIWVYLLMVMYWLWWPPKVRTASLPALSTWVGQRGRRPLIGTPESWS